MREVIPSRAGAPQWEMLMELGLFQLHECGKELVGDERHPGPNFFLSASVAEVALGEMRHEA